MAIVRIDGKEVTMSEDVVRMGKEAVIPMLEANGFPHARNAEIEIVGAEKPGAPSIVNVRPREARKGSGGACDLIDDPGAAFLAALDEAQEYINPAVAMAAQAMQAESQGDTEFLERLMRTGEVERVVEAGEREGTQVARMLGDLGHAVPQASKFVPVGF